MPDSQDNPSRPGTRWRLLAKESAGDLQVENRGVFDELVVDDWLHLEQMDDTSWWMRLADARIMIRVQPDGRAKLEIERDAY